MKTKLLSILLLGLLLSSCGEISTASSSTAGSSAPGSSTADSSSSVASYTVSFYDDEGNKIKDETYNQGAVPSFNYDKTDTAEWNYTFTGWAAAQGGTVISSLPAVSGNVSYYAVITKVKQKYTLTFDSNGGSAVAAINVDYGTSIEKPTDPTYESMKFVSWCSDEALTTAVSWPYTLSTNVTFYAKWNEVINIKNLLKAMLTGIVTTPLSYVPASMKIGAEANLAANESDITYDFTSSVNVSSIDYGGFGEQWNMVMDNMRQSQTFFKVLTAADTGITAGVTAFNNYFDKNPSDTASYSTKVGDYSVKVAFKDNVLDYVLEFDINNPFSEGTIKAQIAMNYQVLTKVKCVRIQIGEPNALKYEISNDSYTFAIKYLGIRRAQCELTKNSDGSISGKINEHLTVSSVDYASCAMFEIGDDYISVVGNKASGILGFKNYICELYKASTGKLLGYQIMETKTVSAASVTFNTLWLNLDEVTGITKIKEITGQDDTSLNGIFINDSTTKFATKNVGGLSLKTASRRFDIEMRTRVYYTYDSEKEVYVEHDIKVPMLFVQQEQLDTLVNDIKSTNSIDVTLTTNTDSISKIESDYTTLIPEFIKIKDAVSSDAILDYIGSAYAFE